MDSTEALIPIYVLLTVLLICYNTEVRKKWDKIVFFRAAIATVPRGVVASLSSPSPHTFPASKREPSLIRGQNSAPLFNGPQFMWFIVRSVLGQRRPSYSPRATFTPRALRSSAIFDVRHLEKKFSFDSCSEGLRSSFFIYLYLTH